MSTTNNLAASAETVEALKRESVSMANSIMQAILGGKFSGQYCNFETGECVSVESHIFEPLKRAGFVMDWEALDFKRGPKKYRLKALKEDPSIKDRPVFSIKPKEVQS